MSAAALLMRGVHGARGLRDAWRTPAVPGYRPGATLRRVVRELPVTPLNETLNETLDETPLPDDGPEALRLPPPPGAVACRLQERVERHFLMHIVSVELVLRVASPRPARGVIRLHHAGTWRRGALVHRLQGASDDGHCAALAQRVCDDPAVALAMQALDQRRCEIVGEGDTWRLCIEPFGGCDVVNRLPAMRRAVRLGPLQAAALMQAAAALAAVLRQQGDEAAPHGPQGAAA